MATLKPCVKNDFVKDDGKSNIKIRLSHDGKVRYLKTPYYIKPHFLGTDSRIKQKHPKCITLNTALVKLIDEYNDIIASIGPDIRYVDIMTFVNNLRCRDGHGTSFLKYTRKRIVDLYDEERGSLLFLWRL